MRTVKRVAVRLPAKYQDLTPVFDALFTQVMAQFDIRNPSTEFAGGLRYDGARIKIGEDSTTSRVEIGNSDDRTVDIFGGAKAQTQKVMPLINWANAGSLQSAIPLAASADASSATISIAAHDVIYGGETVSYSAGNVIGAPVNTSVYIYADDPELEGGAVTYEFTTDHTELAGSRHRYFVGVILTPVSSISVAVAGASNANPCVVTTGANHNFTTGDPVVFDAVGGMTELNSGTFVITVTSPTSFSLNGTDATGFGVYTSGGTVTRVSTPSSGLGGAGGGYEYYDPEFFY